MAFISDPTLSQCIQQIYYLRKITQVFDSVKNINLIKLLNTVLTVKLKLSILLEMYSNLFNFVDTFILANFYIKHICKFVLEQDRHIKLHLFAEYRLLDFLNDASLQIRFLELLRFGCHRLVSRVYELKTLFVYKYYIKYQKSNLSTK